MPLDQMTISLLCITALILGIGAVMFFYAYRLFTPYHCVCDRPDYKQNMLRHAMSYTCDYCGTKHQKNALEHLLHTHSNVHLRGHYIPSDKVISFVDAQATTYRRIIIDTSAKLIELWGDADHPICVEFAYADEELLI